MFSSAENAFVVRAKEGEHGFPASSYFNNIYIFHLKHMLNFTATHIHFWFIFGVADKTMRRVYADECGPLP